MSLVDSEDDEEADEDTNSKKWENLKNSISEHNNLLSNSSQCIDDFSFPIPLSRGTSLVPPYAALYPSESDTSETGLLTLSRACSQTLNASIDPSFLEVDDRSLFDNMGA